MPSMSLKRMNRGRERAAVDVLRHGTLQDHAEHAGIVVHRDEPGLAFLLRERRAARSALRSGMPTLFAAFDWPRT